MFCFALENPESTVASNYKTSRHIFFLSADSTGEKPFEVLEV